MKFSILVIAGSLILASSAAFAAMNMDSEFFKATHIDTEADGAVYEKLLAQREDKISIFTVNQLDDILAMGKRNLDFLKGVNAARNGQNTISLSKPETQPGNPIEVPRIYNPTIVRSQYNQLQKDMPKELAAVIFGNGPLPTTLPVSDDVYVEWGLKADRVYQIAARWLLMEPYLPELAERRAEDIRGYYYMSKIPDVLTKLDNFKTLSAEEQGNYKLWLVMLCGNTGTSYPNCTDNVNKAVAAGKAKAIYQQYLPYGKAKWDDMMVIPDYGHFPDVHWNSDTDVRIPFVRTDEPAINDFLKKNIEEEWQSGTNFVLKTDFDLKSSSAIFITWQPGTTPHVPGLGANEIVMDANAPLTEYDVQWTIRHEFGHNLGFPDCYVEFYDDSIQAMTSYQLDITDLMCSRKGHLKARHVSEMKRVYGK